MTEKVKQLVQALVAELQEKDEAYTFVDTDPPFLSIAWKGQKFISFFQTTRNGVVEWGATTKHWLSNNNHIKAFYKAEYVETDKRRAFDEN